MVNGQFPNSCAYRDGAPPLAYTRVLPCAIGKQSPALQVARSPVLRQALLTVHPLQLGRLSPQDPAKPVVSLDGHMQIPASHCPVLLCGHASYCGALHRTGAIPGGACHSCSYGPAGSGGPGAPGQGPRPSGPHPEANKWLLAPFLPVDVRLVGGGMLALGLVYW